MIKNKKIKMMNIEIDVVRPGSYYSVIEGCTCPILTNNYGQGASPQKGKNSKFYINVNCPVHGRLTTK